MIHVKARDLKKSIEILQQVFGKDALLKDVIRKLNK